MSGRLIEVFLPTERLELARSSIAGSRIVTMWTEKLSETHSQLHILTDSANSGKVTGMLTSTLADSLEDVRIVSLPIEASIPYTKNLSGGIGYDELRQDILEMVTPSVSVWILTFLSAVVAAAGLYRNSATVLIGAMVIAPLLGPTLGLALGLVHFDRKLLGVSLLEMVTRGLIAALFSTLLGAVFGVDPTVPEIASRLHVGTSDLVLALASGAAGAIALSSGSSLTLIGVMVAVALMPPLVTAGLLFGGGYSGWQGGLMLFAVNFACVIVSAAAVFAVKGIARSR